MSLLAALALATMTVKWEYVGPSGANPAEVTTGPGMHHAIRQEVASNRVRYIVNDTELPWLTIGSNPFAYTTPDGKDWYYTFWDGKERVLWVNGKEDARGFDSASVVSVKPKIRVFTKGGISRLERDGKVVLQSTDLWAGMTPTGLLTTFKTNEGRWEARHDKWRVTSDESPTYFVLADKRVVLQAGSKAYIDGKPVEGLPAIGTNDDILPTPSGYGWYLSRSDRRFWLNGKEVKVTRPGLELVEDLTFERGILMKEPVDKDDEEAGFYLYRARTDGMTWPVASIAVQDVTAYSEGVKGGYAMLVELGEDHYAVLREDLSRATSVAKIVWESRGNYPETTEYCGLALTPSGDRLGFVTEGELGMTVHVNNQRFGPYSSVEYLEGDSVIFSPDGKRFAYVAEQKRGDPLCLMVDGKPTDATFDRAVKYGDPVWESNSRIKMMVGKGGKVYRVTVNL